MTTLKINNQESPFVAVPTPIDARGFIKSETGHFVYLHGQGIFNMLSFIELDFDIHTIIGEILPLDNEGVKVMVEGLIEGKGMYKNFENGNHYFYNDWQSSVRSLLAHNGIEIGSNQKVLIIKKI